MKTKVFFLVVGLVCSLIFSGCQNDQLLSPESSDLSLSSSGEMLVQEQLAIQKPEIVVDDIKNIPAGEVKKEALVLLNDFMQAQYDYLLGKDPEAKFESFYASDADKHLLNMKIEMDLMLENMEYNANPGFDRLSGSINFDLTDNFGKSLFTITLVDDVWVLDAIEERVDFQPKNRKFNTVASKAYKAYLKKENGIWKLKNWEMLSIQDYVDGYKPEGPFPRWQVEKTGPVRRTIGASFRSSSGRALAKSFAHDNYNKKSDTYPDYSNHGGDCTNFVSQCLEAGGWEQTPMQNRGSDQSWFHKKGKSMPDLPYRSTSWTKAEFLQDFFAANSDRATYGIGVYSRDDYEIGDVIQLLRKSGRARHSAIITKLEEVDGKIKVYVTQRSPNSIDYDIDESDYDKNRIYWKIHYWKKLLT